VPPSASAEWPDRPTPSSRDTYTSSAIDRSPQEQGTIIREHSVIGRAYGEADLVHDIRLACHGLDRNDNDFVIGLIGRDLFPLSAIVQKMRGTQQTSLYLERLGPFLVGKVVWQSAQ